MEAEQAGPESPGTPAQINYKLFFWSRFFELAKDLIRGCTFIGLAYFAVEAVGLLAGKTTEASLILGYFSSAGEMLTPWIVAFVGVTWGYGERRLRQRKTEYLQGRLAALEREIDPNRTTSNLLPNGQTRPEDRVL